MKKKWILWAASFAFIVFYGMWLGKRYSISQEKQKKLPDFFLMGATSESKKPMGMKDFLGHPWIASFIFTNCGGPCPMITATMKRLEAILPQEVKLVSFSVDPDRDTPEVLEDYAKKFKAQANRWFFLTGNKGALYKLMYEGFNLPLAENKNAPSEFRITHSTKLVLIDSQGRIQGYYDTSDEDVIADVKKDVLKLLKRTSL